MISMELPSHATQHGGLHLGDSALAAIHPHPQDTMGMHHHHASGNATPGGMNEDSEKKRMFLLSNPFEYFFFFFLSQSIDVPVFKFCFILCIGIFQRYCFLGCL